MIKYNSKKRKMEYGMNFDSDWGQGSTSTVVQGRQVSDKTSEALATGVQIAGNLAPIVGGLVPKKTDLSKVVKDRGFVSKDEFSTEKTDMNKLKPLETGDQQMTAKKGLKLVDKGAPLKVKSLFK